MTKFPKKIGNRFTLSVHEVKRHFAKTEVSGSAKAVLDLLNSASCIQIKKTMSSFLIFVLATDERNPAVIVAEALKLQGLSWNRMESYHAGYGVSELPDGRVVSDFEQNMYRIHVILRETEPPCGSSGSDFARGSGCGENSYYKKPNT